MKPPKRQMEYEKIKTDDFVAGTISEIVYDQEHLFKGYNGEPDTHSPGVRLVFTVDGYKFAHKTPWMRFSYSAKANLYKKFVAPLVANAEEYMEFDLDLLKGMKVRMLWADNGEYQNIETIRPIGDKVPYTKGPQPKFAETVENESEDQVPF